MASAGSAGPQLRFPEPIPLEHLREGLIEPLLEEEIEQYEEYFQWDFRSSANLVSKLVAEKSLAGMALMSAGTVAGYGYYILEDHKAVIGDVYMRETYATASNERLLMASLLESIRSQPGVFRIEAQPMMLRFRYSHPRATVLRQTPLGNVEAGNNLQP